MGEYFKLGVGVIAWLLVKLLSVVLEWRVTQWSFPEADRGRRKTCGDTRAAAMFVHPLNLSEWKERENFEEEPETRHRWPRWDKWFWKNKYSVRWFCMCVDSLDYVSFSFGFVNSTSVLPFVSTPDQCKIKSRIFGSSWQNYFLNQLTVIPLPKACNRYIYINIYTEISNSLIWHFHLWKDKPSEKWKAIVYTIMWNNFLFSSNFIDKHYSLVFGTQKEKFSHLMAFPNHKDKQSLYEIIAGLIGTPKD